MRRQQRREEGHQALELMDQLLAVHIHQQQTAVIEADEQLVQVRVRVDPRGRLGGAGDKTVLNEAEGRNLLVRVDIEARDRPVRAVREENLTHDQEKRHVPLLPLQLGDLFSALEHMHSRPAGSKREISAGRLERLTCAVAALTCRPPKP